MNYVDRIARDIKTRVPVAQLPEGDTTVLFRIYAVLALAKGQSTTPEDVHNGWSAWMAGVDPEHQAIEPFAALAPEVRREDDVFVQAIRAASVEHWE